MVSIYSASIPNVFMTEDQAKEMLVLLSEMLLEQRRTNDRLESLERGQHITNDRLERLEEGQQRLESEHRISNKRLSNIEQDMSAIKGILTDHEQRLNALEHE
jgi:septal ring factor EnvC (AmiA/AmiB activator)